MARRCADGVYGGHFSLERARLARNCSAWSCTRGRSTRRCSRIFRSRVPSPTLLGVALPHDAASVALDAPGAVVEVGGGTTALAALAQHARVVIAIEPDPRVFNALEERAEQLPGSRFFYGFRDAAAESAGRRQMLFKDSEPGESCFDCLDEKEKDVFAAEVRVDTVDNFLRSAGLPEILDIALLEVDTKGSEEQVLRGAGGVLGRAMVNAVLINFDTRLLKTRDNAIAVLDLLLMYELDCLHLETFSRKGRMKDSLQFEKMPLTAANKACFYEFLANQGGRTQILCLRRPKGSGLRKIKR